MTWVASEDKPGYPLCLISLVCPLDGFVPYLPMKPTAKTDQTGQTSRLIQVIAGYTGLFVGFVML